MSSQTKKKTKIGWIQRIIQNKTVFIESKGFQRPKRVGSNDFITKHHNKHHVHAHYAPHRPKMPPPIFWERPNLYFPNWDPNVHYVNYQDDNYFDDYYNHRQHNDCCRYDSDSNINANKPKLMSPPPASPSNYGAYCSNRFYTKPTSMHQCYSCERSTSSLALPNPTKFNKVQRTVWLSLNIFEFECKLTCFFCCCCW